MKPMPIGLQGLGLIARKGLIALSFLIVARTSGPNIFGQYTYLYTWMYLFFVLSSLGLPPVSTREIARFPLHASGILKTTFIARFGAALLAVVLLIAVAVVPNSLHRIGVARAVLLFALLIPLYVLLDQFGAYVMGFCQNGRFALINTIQWGSFVLATLAAAWRKADLEVLVAYQVVGMWFGFAMVCVLLKDNLKDAWRAHVNRREAWHLFKEAIPLAVTSVLGLLYFRIGTLYLFQYAGAYQTGLFTSALQVLEALQLIPMAVVGALFPVMSRHTHDPQKLGVLFEKINSLLMFVGLFIAATGSVVSMSIIRLIFGAHFSSSGVLLQLLIWAVVPNFLAFSLGYFLISLNRQILVTFISFIGVVVSVTLSVLLIPRYGVLGAVYGSVLTESCICVLCLVFVLRHVRIAPPVRLASIAAAGAAVVWALGTIWNREINATLFHAAGFGALSLGLFASGFLLYRRLLARLELA